MKKISVFRFACKDDVLRGPEGTEPNGMPRCLAWECSNASFLDIPVFKEGRIFAFTKEQVEQTFSLEDVQRIADDGFVIYEIETTSYEIHDDQVTFDFEGSVVIGPVINLSKETPMCEKPTDKRLEMMIRRGQLTPIMSCPRCGRFTSLEADECVHEDCHTRSVDDLANDLEVLVRMSAEDRSDEYLTRVTNRQEVCGASNPNHSVGRWLRKIA